jgi:hypothetical protein
MTHKKIFLISLYSTSQSDVRYTIHDTRSNHLFIASIITDRGQTYTSKSFFIASMIKHHAPWGRQIKINSNTVFGIWANKDVVFKYKIKYSNHNFSNHPALSCSQIEREFLRERTVRVRLSSEQPCNSPRTCGCNTMVRR